MSSPKGCCYHKLIDSCLINFSSLAIFKYMLTCGIMINHDLHGCNSFLYGSLLERACGLKINSLFLRVSIEWVELES